MGKRFWCDNKGPFVDTTLGTVRGYQLDDLYVFHGIKYAKTKRFEMPEPADRWDGVREAITYGPVCPTINKLNVGPDAAHALDPCFAYNFWPDDEDCQYVNVWTKNINNGVRKPVMVWVHGGGFAGGSSVEQHSYDPSNLASENDIVVVSLNHRLNILGYFDLSQYGEKYAHSGNVGMADIVLALKWVRDNIEKFGGDPGNVTLFGQSGGGGKIQALMQMPSAYDLFHKAILQSGVLYPFGDEDKKVRDGRLVADEVVKELGLTKETIDEIQTVPLDDLKAAYRKVAAKLAPEGVDVGFAPVKDEGYYLGNAANVGFSEKFLSTPLICGSCQCETYHFENDFSNYDWSDEEKYARVKSRLGDRTDEMIELFKKTYPDDDILNLYHLDLIFRTGELTIMDGRAKASDAPIYAYIIDYTFKLFGGMPTYHGADLPMVFNNTDRVLCCREPEARKLGDEISRAWANFAKCGDPNHDFMPEWKTYTKEAPYTMVFANKDRCECNFDRELIDRYWEVAPKSMGNWFHRKRKDAEEE